ncbi:MAG TPA: LytR C-terminal domain-containing protein [Mycobacteriales bacterium]|nr:LytR C-terminal domain-containing protein [Mycobacteriales bacterium]
MRRSLLGSTVAVATVAGLVGVLQAWGGEPPTTGPGFVVAPTATATAPAAPPAPSESAPGDAGLGPLLVLNNSRVTGLAADAAAQFRRQGWAVTGTGNLRGRIRATTIYYAPGQAATAHRLAARFPAIQRVLPRIPGLPGDAPLTVVLTRDYASGAAAVPADAGR